MAWPPREASCGGHRIADRNLAVAPLLAAGLAVQSSTRPLGGDLVDEKNVPGAGTRKP